MSVRHVDGPQTAELSAAWLINAKGIAQRVLAQGTRRNRDANDAALRDLSRRLFLVRQQLGRLALSTPAPNEVAQRQLQLSELGKQEQELAKQLR